MLEKLEFALCIAIAAMLLVIMPMACSKLQKDTHLIQFKNQALELGYAEYQDGKWQWKKKK